MAEYRTPAYTYTSQVMQFRRGHQMNSIESHQELRRIQRQYLDLIDEYFSPIYHYATDDVDHRRFADFISHYPLIADLLQNSLEDLGEDIADFWTKEGPTLRQHLTDLDGLKCLYSGDISPADAGHLLKKSALYVDTTIIPDPISRITKQLKPIALNNREYLNLLIRHVFNIRRIRELLVSDSNYPVAIVAPVGVDHLDAANGTLLVQHADRACVDYINSLFGIDRKEFAEIFDWAKGIDKAKDIGNLVKDHSILPSDLQNANSLAAAVRSFRSGKKDFGDKSFAAYSIGQDLVVYLRTYFIRVEEHKRFCGELGAEPLYDFKRAWFFMNRALGGPDIDSGIIQALQDKRFSWIGNAPISAIKQLRENGDLEYMRQTLRTGIHQIKTKQDKDLESTVSQVQKNLDECFSKQQSDIRTIERRIQEISKVDFPITVIAALLGWIPGAGNLLTAPFSVRDIWKQWKESSAKKLELATKRDFGINLLFQSKP